jgi:myxalamid-type polyketide synthase MxaB
LAEATLFVTGGLSDQVPTIIQLNSRDLMSDSTSYSLEGEKNQEYVSCGRNWLEQEILIVDPDTLEVCDPGRVGEIWVSGQHVAHGYWQNPVATRETFQAYLPGTQKGPFMRTGDLGFFMEGELYIAGRLKDLIIIDGLNHYPQDIELTVERSHPGVRPDFTAAFSIVEKGSEKLVVVAEFQRQYRDEIDEAHKAVLQAIAEEHEVRAHDVVFIKTRTIPKTASGKIQRHLCKAEYLSGQLREIG